MFAIEILSFSNPRWIDVGEILCVVSVLLLVKFDEHMHTVSLRSLCIAVNHVEWKKMQDEEMGLIFLTRPKAVMFRQICPLSDEPACRTIVRLNIV